MRDARQTAEAGRTEGVAISADLREMGSSLRVNAEHLLGDVQMVHPRLRADIDHLERRARRGGPNTRTSSAPRASRALSG